MDALVVFSSENNHPLQFLLSKKRRHVFCAICDDDRGHWLSYDWHQGIPIIRCEAGSNFDLKSFYQEQGYEVVETTVGTTPPHGPLQWNNCVGHVKTILALNTYALVPNGLYKYLTKTRWSFFRTLSFIPGFGGTRAAAPLPPPVAVPYVAPQSDMAKAAEKNLSDADQKRLKLGKYKVASKTKTTKKKTLLSTTDEQQTGDNPNTLGKSGGSSNTSKGISQPGYDNLA